MEVFIAFVFLNVPQVWEGALMRMPNLDKCEAKAAEMNRLDPDVKRAENIKMGAKWVCFTRNVKSI